MNSPAVADRPVPDDLRDADGAATDAKSIAELIIQNQPPDAGLDDILRALGFHRVVERGLADAEAGRLMSQETFRRKMGTWLG